VRLPWVVAALLGCLAAWRAGQPWSTLARFTVLSWALTLAAALTSGFFNGDRYYHPLLLWPWVWLLMGLARLHRDPRSASAILVGPLFLLAGVLAVLPGLRSLPLTWSAPYPAALRSLDAAAASRGLHHGYSNYGSSGFRVGKS